MRRAPSSPPRQWTGLAALLAAVVVVAGAFSHLHGAQHIHDGVGGAPIETAHHPVAGGGHAPDGPSPDSGHADCAVCALAAGFTVGLTTATDAWALCCVRGGTQRALVPAHARRASHAWRGREPPTSARRG